MLKMIPRTGKSISLKLYDKWKIVYGCLNFKNPLTLYVKLQTWITPKSELSMDNINIIYNTISNYRVDENGIFDSKFIKNVSFAEKKMCVNKQTCLLIKFILKQKNGIIPFNLIQPHVKLFIDDFMVKTEKSFEYYFELNYSKTKKEIYQNGFS